VGEKGGREGGGVGGERRGIRPRNDQILNKNLKFLFCILEISMKKKFMK
jgi:hypothetical protein